MERRGWGGEVANVDDSSSGCLLCEVAFDCELVTCSCYLLLLSSLTQSPPPPHKRCEGGRGGGGGQLLSVIGNIISDCWPQGEIHFGAIGGKGLMSGKGCVSVDEVHPSDRMISTIFIDNESH